MVYVALCQAIELEKLMNVTPSWFTARAFTALYLIILTRSCTARTIPHMHQLNHIYFGITHAHFWIHMTYFINIPSYAPKLPQTGQQVQQLSHHNLTAYPLTPIFAPWPIIHASSAASIHLIRPQVSVPQSALMLPPDWA
jgi:hypothetical protein